MASLTTLLDALLVPLEVLPTTESARYRRHRASAVIFDVYGTLLCSAAGDIGIDAAKDNASAVQQAVADGGLQIGAKAAARGAELVPGIIREHRREAIEAGHPHPEVNILAIWRAVFERLDLDVPEPGLLRRIALSYECRTNPVWPMPGSPELLLWLRRQGIALGLLSNAQFYTPLVLEHLFRAPLHALGFANELCLYSFQQGQGKPAPILFEALNRRLLALGHWPDQVLYVGNDVIKDIEPAATVGWVTVLFAGDGRSLRWHDRRVQPDMLITDLVQLGQILQ